MPFEKTSVDQQGVGRKEETPLIPEKREAESAFHPVILGGDSKEAGELYHSQDKIICTTEQGQEEMSFDEYLEMLGIDYGRYYKACQIVQSADRPINQVEILANLHNEVIAERDKRSHKLEREFSGESPYRDNLRESTTREHSPQFILTFNDLGIDGLKAETAPAKNDVLDSIDEFLVLDPKELKSQGEKMGQKFYIGIQRSFRQKEMVRNRLKFLPENIERGPIFIASITEEISEYQSERYGKNSQPYYQDLFLTWQKRARQTNKKMNQVPRPPIYEFLPGGAKGMAKKAVHVLEEIDRQMSEYLKSEEFLSQSPRLQRMIKDNYKRNWQLKGFIKAVNEELEVLEEEPVAA